MNLPILILAHLLWAAVGPAAPPLTLPAAEAKALDANPRVVAARLDALAAAKRTAQAKGRRFGEIDVVGSYANFESPRLVRPMSIALFDNPSAGFSQLPWDDNQVHYGVTYELPLLTGGAIPEGIRIASLAQSAADESARFTRDQVRTSVRAAYREALLARHVREAAEAYRAALAKDEADARLKVKVGALAPVDAAKLTFALRGAEAEVATREAQERTAYALLGAIMGEDAPAAGYELANLPDEPKETSGEAPALEGALASRQDLAAARDATRVAERRKALAAKAMTPRLVLEGNWLRNDAPSLDHALDTHEIYLMFKVPVFDGLTRVHALEEARVNLEAARERERAKELEIASQIADARGRVDAARARLAAAKTQRDLGHEVARVERVRLDQGAGKVEDYLTARAQELAGETAYWSGLYALQNAVDYLNFVTAREGVE